MPRARFQEGSLLIVGEGPTAKYQVKYRVYDDLAGTSMQKKQIIGLVSKMSKRDANKRKQEIVTRGTLQLPEAVGVNRATMTLRQFYEDKYLPLKINWTQVSRDKTTYNIKTFVLPRFGDLALGDIDRFMIQEWLNNAFLGGMKLSTIRHHREWLSGILAVAFEEEFINRNPATKTVLPKDAEGPDHSIMSGEQLIMLLRSTTDARDKAILHVGTFCAPRPSELFGLSWKQFFPDAECFMIDQIADRGKLYQRTKNEVSKTNVTISPNTMKALIAWQKECPDTSPDALIFPSTNKNGRSKKGAPMDGSTWMQKKIQPTAKRLGIEVDVNFRLLRRTASTIMKDHGESTATVAAHLRHDPKTDEKVYQQPVPESVKRAVNDYEARVYAAKPNPPKLQLVK